MMGITTTKTYSPKTVVQLLLVMTGVLFGLYMYFVASSVVHVVIRTEVEQVSQKLKSEISLLENNYIAAQHKVSRRISSLEGYDEVTEKVFIDRTAPSLVLGSTE